MDSTKERFSTKLGLILSVLGIAIGTGNIWRFPRIVAQNGGETGAGAFLLAWIMFLFIWSIPLIIAEYGLGRNGRTGVIGAFTKLIGEKKGWMGGFIGFVATAIMFYYSVVTGWCIYYLWESIASDLPSSAEQSKLVWDTFQNSNWPVFTHFLAMFFGGLVVIKGVKSIERVNKVLIPTLIFILLISLVKSVSLSGSNVGIKYLFTINWSDLANPSLWLDALTQNAWDTGAAWGLIMTYAAYMRMQDDITVSAFQAGIGNNIISLVSAIIIFSTVFGSLGSEMSISQIVEVMKDSGPASTGLTFMWLPQLFAGMTGGGIFSVLFFLGLTFAAFSSLLSMIELAVRIFIDAGINRKKATILIGAVGFILGVPSASNLTIFENQDFVWSVGLVVSGAFVSYAVIKFGAHKFRTEIVNVGEGVFKLPSFWEILMKYIVPVEAVTLLVWWIYQSAVNFAPDTWYHPLSTYSVATVLLQFAVAMGLMYWFNRKLIAKRKALAAE